MDRVFAAHERSFDQLRHVAIAIAAIDSEQRHVGILHKDAQTETVLMLDLAWHHRLRNQPPQSKYLWVDPAIPARRLVQVAAWCRKIWRSNRTRIPYAFSMPNDCFEAETGTFLIGPTRHGLTCATFILAVFDVAGLKLANYVSWPIDRPGDREWQEKVVASLQADSADDTHINAARAEIGSGAARFRPEEVAGAATVWPLPAEFAVAVERGAMILEKLPS